jgi:hypothetical protein
MQLSKVGREVLGCWALLPSCWFVRSQKHCATLDIKSLRDFASVLIKKKRLKASDCLALLHGRYYTMHLRTVLLRRGSDSILVVTTHLNHQQHLLCSHLT